jgi:hypothetical protein
MKNLIFATMLLFCSCKGYDATIIERQKSLKEVCPTCTLSYASLEASGNNFYIAQDTAKQPNIIYQVIFCHGVLQPIWKVDHITKIN